MILVTFHVTLLLSASQGSTEHPTAISVQFVIGMFFFVIEIFSFVIEIFSFVVGIFSVDNVPKIF